MSSYREDRRADRAAERAQDREDRRLELEAAREREAARAEEKRKDAEAKRRQEQADRKAKLAERQAKKAAAAAKRAKLVRWLKVNPATLFVAFVMVASIVPAVLSQIGALTGASVAAPMAGLLAAMLEGGAWAITFMGKQADDSGREPRKYRIATWAVAVVAAAVNFWHGLEQYRAHPWVALVLGASSLFAIYIWDLKTHGSHGKTKAEKKAEKDRARHVAARRKHHPQIVEAAVKLQSALPFGVLDDEAAFAAAWRIHTGAEPGLSAELYATATNAVLNLGAAFELGDNVREELLETGFKAARLNPFPELTQAPESQAGIGSNTPEKPVEPPRQNGPRGRSEEELKELLPDALTVAADLVAEGRQISASALAKRLQIRREDAVVLRDLVVAQRRLHVA
ncbi:hypothetical protein ACFY8W_14550 [Streptomyces sp. NPDC012637]|uniref:hypothetical protein n=1 Tax=Streptomyces sp. NPDC012637 TaxID=3364842 RepID=UPI0036E099EA